MEKKILRQKELMERENIDALISSSPEMICYTTGVSIPSQSIIRERLAFCVNPLKGEPVAIVVNIEEDYVKSESSIEDIRSYNEFTQNPVNILVDIIEELKLTKGKIGIELDYIATNHFEILREKLPDTEFINSREYFYALREIKTSKEVELIKEIGKAAEKSIYTAFAELKPGMSEKELARMLVGEYYSRGGEKIGILVVATGERSSFLNASASDRIIKKGDMIRVDLIGTKQGYYSDVCRTAVVGKPTDEQKRIWEVIVQARKLVLKQLKPGVNTKDIYKEYQEFISRNDLTPIDFVGHGLGLGLHEEPYIGKYGGTTLKPNMVLCVEPIHIIPDKMGFQLEDEILITDDGHKLLTGVEQSNELPVIK